MAACWLLVRAVQPLLLLLLPLGCVQCHVQLAAADEVVSSCRTKPWMASVNVLCHTSCVWGSRHRLVLAQVL